MTVSTYCRAWVGGQGTESAYSNPYLREFKGN